MLFRSPVLMEKRFLAVELLSLLFLWGAYFISVRYRRQRLLATGWILLLGGLLSMAITLMVSGQFSHFISGITLASSGGGLLLGCAWQPWLRVSRPTKEPLPPPFRPRREGGFCALRL